MSFLIDLIHNRVLLAAVLSWFLAQGLKMVLDLINGRFTVNRLSGGGGMPSAHSATVCGLTAATALTSGGSSPEFAIALFLMYDAMGVRYETGQQAKILNRLRVRDAKEGKEEIQEKPLEEKMGHTLPEIAAGCFIGILVGILIGRM